MLVRVLVAALVALVTATSLTVVSQYDSARTPLQQSQGTPTLQTEYRERDTAFNRQAEPPDILPGSH
jgi:hypothetical protein